MEVITPQPDRDEDGNPIIWPSLGPQVCAFLEERFCYGPGPLRGQPYKVRDDIYYILYRAYEHYPEGYALDYDGETVELSGRRHFNKVAISLPKGSSKCLAPDTELMLRSGERILAKDAVAGQEIMSFADGEVVYRRIAAVEEQPAAMTYRVKTGHGREIEVSEGHPFLVSGTQWRDGMPKYHKYSANDPKVGKHSWSAVEDLAPGDRLVPALNWKRDLDDQSDLGWLLGVLAGDACGDGRFSNGDKEITDKISENYELTRLKSNGTSVDWYIRGIPAVLREHGLFGCNAYTKRVPEAVLRGSRSMALGYLAGLLDTDGCTVFRPKGNGKTTRLMEWYSVSEQNMRDLQTVLASVGINADVRTKRSRYRGEPYTSWTVVVSNKADLKRLAEELPCVRRRNVDNLAEFRKADSRGQFADVHLDKVESVEPIGETVTIGIEVEDTHVHVTNGLVTHNTEVMALVAVLELHPDAPVRFSGYDPSAPGGLAPGRAVSSPFIPLLAPTKDQLNDLAYGAAQVIASDIEDSDLFDVTNDRIMLQGESESKIIPVAADPKRLDGLKPTFQGIDEPHRLFTDRHRKSYDTMGNNLAKRAVDDPWELTCTTAGDPNEPSVARDQYQTGLKTAEGKIQVERTFFYHRQTSDANAKFDTMGDRIRALKESSGPEVAAYRDLFSVAAEWDKSGADKTYLERVWCNRWTQSSQTAFDADAFRALGDEELFIEPGSLVTLGFDGAVTQDSTGLVMTDVETGVQNLVGLWERPAEAETWRVPIEEVNDLVESVFESYNVWRMYCDPPYWQESISRWSGLFEGKVVEWPTRNLNNIYYAIRSYKEAIGSGDLAHNGDPDLLRHIANAGVNYMTQVDDEGYQKYRLSKITQDRKFDAAMAAILSWQARLDALKSGAENEVHVQVPMRIR